MYTFVICLLIFQSLSDQWAHVCHIHTYVYVVFVISISYTFIILMHMILLSFLAGLPTLIFIDMCLLSRADIHTCITQTHVVLFSVYLTCINHIHMHVFDFFSFVLHGRDLSELFQCLRRCVTLCVSVCLPVCLSSVCQSD